MTLTMEVPDGIARSLRIDGPDAERQTLEFIALQGYQSGRLSRGQVGELLDFSFHETQDFLKANGAELPMTIAEAYEDARAIEKLFAQ